MPRAQNMREKGSILKHRRNTLLIWVYNLSMSPTLIALSTPSLTLHPMLQKSPFFAYFCQIGVSITAIYCIFKFFSFRENTVYINFSKKFHNINLGFRENVTKLIRNYGKINFFYFRKISRNFGKIKIISSNFCGSRNL